MVAGEGGRSTGVLLYKCFIEFKVTSITRGWVGVQFLGNKRYVTIEWPLVFVENMLYKILLLWVEKFVIMVYTIFPIFDHFHLPVICNLAET